MPPAGLTASDLLEVRADAEVYTLGGNARMAVCYAGKRYGRNPTSGLYVPVSDQEMGADRDLRIASAAGAFRTVKGLACWDLYDDTFGAARVRKTIRVEKRRGGSNWDALALPMVAQAAAPAGEGATYTFTFTGPDGTLVASYAVLYASGKWTYTFTPTASGTYRLVLGGEILVQPQDVRLFQCRTAGKPVGTVSFVYGEGDTIDMGWADMIRAGQFDTYRRDAAGAQIFTLGFPLAAGQALIVDPSFSSNSGWGCECDSGTTYPNDGGDVCGWDGGVEYRVVNRFSITTLGVSDTVTQADFGVNVQSISGTLTTRTWVVGKYNGTGQGDPSADTAANVFSRCNLNGNASWRYLTGQTAFRTTGQKTLTLGATANTDIATARGAGNNFSVAVQMEGTDPGGATWPSFKEYTAGANPPSLTITYTTGGGGAAKVPWHLFHRRAG